ncbi:hypothetical protein O181_037614 [Austropuccinia psidii MF-1]|uniref:Uncharacterized protein n=1 Tax=Austropuccinia psidii MF-1 TaxID=1389203 RepID=A0A9Q3D6Q5_9BASI|nr:hypothetical protein [Austropuccinia psidii MF-1]
MGDGLTFEAKVGLAVEGFGEGGGIEDGMVKRTGWKFLWVLEITSIWNILEEFWESAILDWCPIELVTTSTTPSSSSSLPSALGSVGESAAHLSLFTTPWLLILEMGSSQLE